MKAAIKNTSRAPQGVHTTDGLKFIEPGSTRILDVHEDYVSRVKSLPFLDAKWHDGLAPNPVPANPVPASPIPPNPVPPAPAAEVLDRDELKKQAGELEIEYPRNITNEKLKELIDAKLAA